MSDVIVGGISVVMVILGLVEFAKKFGLSGNWCILVTFLLSTAFSVVIYGVEAGLFSEALQPWIQLVTSALAFGLGACGLYDFSKRFRPTES